MATAKNAKLWFMIDWASLTEHVEVIGVYVLCPLLYGHAHQSDIWLRWCTEVGLLPSDMWELLYLINILLSILLSILCLN